MRNQATLAQYFYVAPTATVSSLTAALCLSSNRVGTEAMFLASNSTSQKTLKIHSAPFATPISSWNETIFVF